jgi:hypothetical protein
VFVKGEDELRKIDAGVAATLAVVAAETMPEAAPVAPRVRWLGVG